MGCLDTPIQKDGSKMLFVAGITRRNDSEDDILVAQDDCHKKCRYKLEAQCAGRKNIIYGESGRKTYR
jgi:hypothetical protein